MAEDDAKSKRQMPKGGAKGGARFPRHKLDTAIAWATKLVGKTHVEPQPADVIYAGVVGAKFGEGKVRVSTLKQYGFLVGDPKAYGASELAKRIQAAPADELTPLKREAFLNAAIFQSLFTTFQGDDVPRAKLRQRASELKVHPEEADGCVEIYVAGLVSAGLGRLEGDRILHEASTASAQSSEAPAADRSVDEQILEEDEEVIDEEEITHLEQDGVTPPPMGIRATFNINITLDASMDADKLEKHLKLLRRYGVR